MRALCVAHGNSQGAASLHNARTYTMRRAGGGDRAFIFVFACLAGTDLRPRRIVASSASGGNRHGGHKKGVGWEGGAERQLTAQMLDQIRMALNHD